MMQIAGSIARFLGLGMIALVVGLWPIPLLANMPANAAQSCDQAAVRAAQATGVPQSILLAIARVESGRTVAGQYGPWPWTINKGGKGAWFSTADEAVIHATQALESGVTNIDIGCFQINYRWHGAAFSDLGAMLEPDRNALYAARYLQKLFAHHRNWEGAIGAYHSRLETAADGYLKKVAALIGEVPTETMARVDPPAQRDNRFPLLRAGKGRMPGSLVSTQGANSATSLLR